MNADPAPMKADRLERASFARFPDAQAICTSRILLLSAAIGVGPAFIGASKAFSGP
ncbi:MAG TPA: hypothetical protein VLS49_01775 [Usitatibacter sp.]|nr:hypothetical protein [Usitatibacter sp.]